MFNINFARFAKNLTPWFLRASRFKQWIGVLSWGSSLALDDLNEFRLLKDYELKFTGQRLYLERWLNDKFDPVNQAINVINIVLIQNPFVFNKIEGRETYSANKYKAATAYVVGDRVSSVGSIWRCISAATGQTPATSPAFWTLDRGHQYLRNKNEIGGAYVFTVEIPNTITLSDQVRNNIKTEVDKFVIAGKNYQIISA